jgi:FlaG/FlaF family flagellin (archaellin)
MNTVLTIAIVLALIATVAVLLMGVFNLMKKDHDPRVSNKLMRYRIILQATAVALIVIVLWLSKH